MRPYVVEVVQTRQARVLVMAESLDDAKADAVELDLEDQWGWDENEIDVYLDPEEGAEPGMAVWTGGPDGEWVQS